MDWSRNSRKVKQQVLLHCRLHPLTGRDDICHFLAEHDWAGRAKHTRNITEKKSQLNMSTSNTFLPAPLHALPPTLWAQFSSRREAEVANMEREWEPLLWKGSQEFLPMHWKLTKGAARLGWSFPSTYSSLVPWPKQWAIHSYFLISFIIN